MTETAQKCCHEVKTKRKKWKKMNDSVTALKKKQPYSIEAHECISYQLLLPYKRV